MTERWKQAVLAAAGVVNILGGVSALADPAGHFAQLYATTLNLDDPLQQFFYRATWINVVAWGIGYALAARHVTARGPILIAGGIGKVVYFITCVALFMAGTGTPVLLAFGLLDVAFAALFAYIVWSQRSVPAHR